MSKARKKLEKYVKAELSDEELDVCGIESITPAELAITVGPDAKEAGTLTEPHNST